MYVPSEIGLKNMVRNRKRLGVRFQLWLVLFVLLIANVHDSVAWGPQSHRVVGFIYESHLQPDIKKLILEKFNINSLADVTALQMRFGKNEKNTYHYTNIAEGQWTYDAARDCPSGSCVTEQIQKFPDIFRTLPYLYSKEKTHLNI